MALLSAAAGLGFIFKDDYFIVAILLQNFGFHLGAAKIRRAQLYFIAVGFKQNFVKNKAIARLDVDLFDFYFLAGGYLILLAAGLYNSKHNQLTLMIAKSAAKINKEIKTPEKASK